MLALMICKGACITDECSMYNISVKVPRPLFTIRLLQLTADDIERERQEFLEKLDACAAPRKQVHELEWELKKRADEIRDLQKVCPHHFHVCQLQLPRTLHTRQG